MKNSNTLFALTAALMLAAPAFAADVSATTKTEYKQGDNGSYESKKVMEKEQSNGTAVKDQTSVSVDKDEDGNVEKKIERKTTTDPKGLMNKTTTKTTETVKDTADKKEYSHKKEVDGDTVEEENNVEIKD